jgi:hypothetical protein
VLGVVSFAVVTVGAEKGYEIFDVITGKNIESSDFPDVSILE